MNATAIELSEVENFLFSAELGPEVGRQFAAVRDPIMSRMVSELGLPLAPSYFYQIWEIAGDKMRSDTPLTEEESVELRQFEQTLRNLGATVKCETIDDQDKTLDQWLWDMCRSVRETLEVRVAVQTAT